MGTVVVRVEDSNAEKLRRHVSISIRPTWWERIKILFGADVCFGCAYDTENNDKLYWGTDARIWVGSIYDN